MFKEIDPAVSFPEMEKKILEFWEQNGIFKKSLEKTEGGERFVFYDGPPFATGKPHYGHLLAGTIKDIIPRYWTMRGKHAERRFGWDTHGLPIESLAQQELGISGTTQILEKGVDVFNEQCRSMVLKYAEA
ncbi:MAG: class I tRNA ligase family protein, partial [Fibrobacterota bacterium]